MGGVPARPIGTFDEIARKLDERTAALPWADLIRDRDGDFDPALEPTLVRLRVEHFYGRGSPDPEPPAGG